ncbi:uncharacterized protein L969DRAFT_93659 [Mixia osmundae IAM 14324]|uniref:uncharacterized protein n=1 Tax=Mixia osmundae (strain CBS 9802 / IAM 14324 / JCM 22182 / KY 12970) TaxID=764103 RepID=UPI0004A5499C|nr:uncharacterized protein L969DRAFT_93659 [Mixia osmundae IAM 14324]KEI39819.1 hypothetical protein L969DRAFT_93659 [Mixia osmundae IAM 14324]
MPIFVTSANDTARDNTDASRSARYQRRRACCSLCQIDFGYLFPSFEPSKTSSTNSVRTYDHHPHSFTPSSTMISKIALVASLAATARAGLSITSPIDTTTCVGNGICNITWDVVPENGSVDQWGSTNLTIYTGSTYLQTPLQWLATIPDLNAPAPYVFGIDPNIGPSFIRFQSNAGTSAAGEPLQAFSSKFTLDGMAGTFNSTIWSMINGENVVIASTSANVDVVATSTTTAASTVLAAAATTQPVSTATVLSSSSKTGGAAKLAAGPLLFAGSLLLLAL